MAMHLNVYLSDKLGRPIRAKDVADVLGISSSTHATRTTSGFSADEVIQLCRHYRIDAADVLTDLGYIEPPTSPRLDTATSAELAGELLRRTEDPHKGGPVSGPESALMFRKARTRANERARWEQLL